MRSDFILQVLVLDKCDLKKKKRKGFFEYGLGRLLPGCSGFIHRFSKFVFDTTQFVEAFSSVN